MTKITRGQRAHLLAADDDEEADAWDDWEAERRHGPVSP